MRWEKVSHHYIVNNSKETALLTIPILSKFIIPYSCQWDNRHITNENIRALGNTHVAVSIKHSLVKRFYSVHDKMSFINYMCIIMPAIISLIF
jgi:hypothetical protein